MEVLKQEKVLSLSFLICHNCSYHPRQVGGDPTELCLFWFHSHTSIFQSIKFDSIKMAWVAFPPFLPPNKVWAHGGLYVGSKIKVKTRNMTIKSTRVTINFQSMSALNSEEFDQWLRNKFRNSIKRVRKVSQDIFPSKSWRRIGVPWQVFESCKTWCRITRSKEGCLPFLGSCSLFCGRQALDHFASVRFFPTPRSGHLAGDGSCLPAGRSPKSRGAPVISSIEAQVIVALCGAHIAPRPHRLGYFVIQSPKSPNNSTNTMWI